MSLEHESDPPNDFSRALGVFNRIADRGQSSSRLRIFLRQQARDTSEVTQYCAKGLIDFVHERGDELAHHVAARGDPEFGTGCLQGYFRLLAFDCTAKEPDRQGELVEQFCGHSRDARNLPKLAAPITCLPAHIGITAEALGLYCSTNRLASPSSSGMSLGRENIS